MTLRCPEAAATRIKRGAGVLVLGEGASDESFSGCGHTSRRGWDSSSTPGLAWCRDVISE